MKQQILQVAMLCLLLNAANISLAQDSSQATAARGSYITSEPSKENIRTYRNNVLYQLELVNDSIASFYIDGKQVPKEQYGKYSTVLQSIREELQRNKAMAKKDQERAVIQQQNAKRAEEAASQHQQLAKLQQEEAYKLQLLAKQDEELAAATRLTAKQAAETATLNQQLAKRQQEQASMHQQAAQLAKTNALIDQKRAAEDQQLLKQLLEDLVKDGLAPDEKSIRMVELSQTQMTVNGKPQPESTLRKYREKYPRLAAGNLTFSNENGQQQLQLHSSQQ